jgi:polysaccharide chain length determinant protein (PEP-CTERM system associated)
MLEMIRGAFSRHRWMAITVFLTILSGALVLAVAVPGIYRATATILVQREGDLIAAGERPADVEARLQIIREEVLSRQRLDMMVVRFDLYPELRRRAPREAIIEHMRKDIRIALKVPDGAIGPMGTIAFSLGFRSADRNLTASVANALAESYVVENQKIRGRQTRSTASLLEAQLSQVREELDAQEVRIGQYLSDYNGELPQQVIVNQARLQQLEMRLQMNRESRLRAIDRRESRTRLEGDGRYPESPVSGETPTDRLTRLTLQLDSLKATYSDSYPDVVRIQNEISSLRGTAVAKPSDTAIRPMQERVTSVDDYTGMLDAEDERLTREISIYRGRVDRAPMREQEFAQLSRDHATMDDMYSALLKSYQEAKLADEMGHDKTEGQLRVLDAAVVPSGPYAPNRVQLLLFAFMASLAASAAAVALAERLDTSFHTVDDLRSFTKVPVLVSIPPLGTRATRWRGRRRFVWMTLLTTACVLFICVATWSIASGNIALAQILAREIS